MHWISHEMPWLLHGEMTKSWLLRSTVSEMSQLVSRVGWVKKNVSESVSASQGSYGWCWPSSSECVCISHHHADKCKGSEQQNEGVHSSKQKHREEVITNMPLFTDKLNEYSWLHAHLSISSQCVPQFQGRMCPQKPGTTWTHRTKWQQKNQPIMQLTHVVFCDRRANTEKMPRNRRFLYLCW